MEFDNIRYYHSEKQKDRFAIPDFYLPKTNEIIEIKGAENQHCLPLQEMKDKFKRYVELGYKVKLLIGKNHIDRTELVI